MVPYFVNFQKIFAKTDQIFGYSIELEIIKILV